MTGSNVAALLEHGAHDHAALIVPDRISLTYAQLRDLTDDAARTLASHGVGKGDRVAMVFPNGPEAILLFLAASMIATACPLNSAYKEDEFRFYLEDVGARFLLAPPGEADAARRAMPANGTVLEAILESDGRLDIQGPSMAKHLDSWEPSATGEIALVLHTSGTTSRPKRVPLRHENLTASVANVIATYELGPEDVSLCIMPLFHVHGLVASALATFGSRGTVVVPDRFSPLGFWPLMQAARPTWFTASPTPHQLVLARLQENRPAGAERLRFVRSCSSALAPAQMALMEERFGVPVLEAYGMTEASHQMSSNPLPPAPRFAGSVGPGTGVEIAIFGEDGAALSHGTAGEVVIRGPNVMHGYENNPEANAGAFFNGWFRTGDLGTLDDSGYLRLISRIKELINRGGEKIAPREIDEVLEGHPAVKEAVAFGVPHPTWGEEVAAAVVLKAPATERELLAHCRARLADFKVPKRLHIVESIPRTATGKVQRRFVAEQLTHA
ncbi:MAG: AMP-dependent synthetase [Actinobacteria bacterium 13_1_20CM_2_65_11]|nr:MAG: AMP-dependent synthetase [Actinobacteria bacterium 13_1_20CM_2_65_11]